MVQIVHQIVHPGLFGTLWEEPNMEESEEPIKARHIHTTKTAPKPMKRWQMGLVQKGELWTPDECTICGWMVRGQQKDLSLLKYSSFYYG